ncbi:MAG: TetR/AcrR family transcriptional regulator [Planctomycetota bacterium]
MSETAAEPPGEAQEGDRFRHAEGPKRSERAHEAILTAAQEVLADVGYQKASIERIARHAGVGKQTIYRWWSSRAALFMEVYTSLAERHVKPPEGEAVEDDLVALWKQLCSFYRRTAAGPALAGLLAEAQSDPRVAATFRDEFLGKRRAVTLDLLRSGVDRGEVDPSADLERTVDLIAGAVWYRLLVDGAPPSANQVKVLVGQLVRGIRL